MEDHRRLDAPRRPRACAWRPCSRRAPRRGACEVALLLELAADLEQRVLGVLDEHQALRSDSGDLAAQLGADRAARAGDEHDVPARDRRRRGRSPRARARGRARPPPAPRAPGASGSTPPESSSKVVGSVRTGMPRSRQAVTTFWRSMPGAEGIAMMTSSGLTPSSTRGSWSVVPSTLCPAMRMPCLRGSSSTKPTARAGSAGLRRSSNATCWPPLPAPDDQHLVLRPLEEGAARRAARPRRAPRSASR